MKYEGETEDESRTDNVLERSFRGAADQSVQTTKEYPLRSVEFLTTRGKESAREKREGNRKKLISLAK